jgi:hypothetical protein
LKVVGASLLALGFGMTFAGVSIWAADREDQAPR